MENNACETISKYDKYLLNKFNLPIEICSRLSGNILEKGLIATINSILEIEGHLLQLILLPTLSEF